MKKRQKRLSWPIRAGTTVLVAGLALLAYWPFPGAHGRSAEPVIPAGVALTSWQDNGRDGDYLLELMPNQTLPSNQQLLATVLTDTHCAPDAQGLSHCHHVLRLPNGMRITVIDTHRMTINRCLQPGNTLSLSAINEHWIMGTLRQD